MVPLNTLVGVLAGVLVSGTVVGEGIRVSVGTVVAVSTRVAVGGRGVLVA